MVYGRGGLSGLRRGVRTFGGLGLQGQPDGLSVSNVFEGSFSEEVTGAVKAIFEGGLNFATSESRKKLYRTASTDRGAIGE